jgi:hypothetical protein
MKNDVEKVTNQLLDTLRANKSIDEILNEIDPQLAIRALSDLVTSYNHNKELLNINKKRLDRLEQYKHNVTSQRGEDGIISKIFEVLPKAGRWCVEVGAWDGKHFSNTWNLINNKNWSSVQIEGNKKRFAQLAPRYKSNSNVTCVNRFVRFDGENTLDNILSQTNIPVEFDLLSIDVDGCDYHIFDSIKKYKPRVVVIEFNPTIPYDIIFIQEKNFNVSHGSSIRAIVELGKNKGYELVAIARGNAFFVRKEQFHLFNMENNDPEVFYKTYELQTRLFQLYDGTLVLDGCTKLNWKDLEFDAYSLQVLPSICRGKSRGFLRHVGNSYVHIKKYVSINFIGRKIKSMQVILNHVLHFTFII